MRVFCFGFIVYLVLMLTQPCQDLVAGVDASYPNDTERARVENTSKDDCPGEECLPFCICSCCSHPVANHRFSFRVTSGIEFVARSTPLTEYTNPYTNAYQTSIWQPPKA